jgi:uncharacterized protein
LRPGISANEDDLHPLVNSLSTFLDYVRPTPKRRQVLAVFINIDGGRTHRANGDAFWSVLQYLHDHDDLPWPDGLAPNPDDPGWEFCFHGTAMFVFNAVPTHLVRRSRNLGNAMVLLFQPRNVFSGIEGGTPTGTVVRRRIRDSLKSWESSGVHPAMGDFGDPSNLEWRQYVIRDDDSEMYPVCPFQPRT